MTAAPAPPTPSRAALLASSAADPDDWGDATDAEAGGYEPSACDLPPGLVAELSAARPASRVLLALNCGTGAGGFRSGNTCARGGYGRDNGIRASRVTKGNITATGAQKGRTFKDAAGRTVTEHTTNDGRVFHEVVHVSGRKSFHKIEGPAKAAAPKAAAGPAKAGGGLADIPAGPRQTFQHRVDAVRSADKAVKDAERLNTVESGAGKGTVDDHDGSVAAAKAVRDKAQAALDEIRPLAEKNGIDFDRAVSEAGGTEHRAAERAAPAPRDFSPAEKDAIEFNRQQAKAKLDAPRLAEEAKQAERAKKTAADVAAGDAAHAKTVEEVTDQVRKGLKPEGEAVFRSGTKAQQKALLNTIQIGTGVHSEDVARQAVAKVLAERDAAKTAAPADFGGRVQAAADAVAAREGPGGRGVSEGGDKVHVAAVHAEYEKQNGPIPLDEFKAKLAGIAGNEGSPDMVREDLLGFGGRSAEVIDSLKRSEVSVGESKYHYVRTTPQPFQDPASAPAPAAPAAGEFPRYRLPDGTMVQVGQSGRIVGGDAKAAGLMGRKAADVGAVPEKEHFAAKAAAAKPVAARDPSLRPGDKGYRPDPAKARAAAASAVPRPPSREAAKRAAARRRYSAASPSPAALLELSAGAEADCDWRTINGSHVCIKGGLIAEGPDHLVGKTPAEAGAPDGGTPAEHPIAAAWRRQAGKMSTPKLKKSIQDAYKFRNAVPNEVDRLKDRILKEELAKRGVKVAGDAADWTKLSAASPSRLALLALAAGPGRPAAVVLSLSAAGPAADVAPPPGMPADIDGQPVTYRRRRIATARPFVHMATGEAHAIDRARMGLWLDAFDRRKARGLYPFIYPRHLEAGEQPDARHTLGYVVGLEASGDDLYATEQYIGEDAARTAARNGRSVTIVSGMDDAGQKYPEMLHHLAATPMPALPEASHFPVIAASGAVVMAPVYVCGPAGCGCGPVPSRAALLALSAGAGR